MDEGVGVEQERVMRQRRGEKRIGGRKDGKLGDN